MKRIDISKPLIIDNCRPTAKTAPTLIRDELNEFEMAVIQQWYLEPFDYELYLQSDGRIALIDFSAFYPLSEKV